MPRSIGDAEPGLAPHRVLGFFEIAEEPAEVHDARHVGLVELHAALQAVFRWHLASHTSGSTSTMSPIFAPLWIISVRRPYSVFGSRIQNTPIISGFGVTDRNTVGRLS